MKKSVEKRHWRTSRWCRAGLLLVALIGILYTQRQRAYAKEDVYMGDIISTYQSLAKGNIRTARLDDGAYKIRKTDEGDFQVLQLTDIHLSAEESYYGRNIKAMDTVYALIQETQPDLLEVTGDLVFAMPYTDAATDEETFRMCIEFFDQIGIPWIWTFGNHDHDFFDRYSKDEVYAMLRRSSTLLQYQEESSVDGYTNGEFRLYNADNTLNRILISIDSHDTMESGGYDYIKENQVQWYAKTVRNDQKLFGKDVQTFVYTHIPLVEYQDAWTAYQNGDHRAKYLYGKKRESVCCSGVRSRLASVMTKLGSTKAIFCGHDHLNDYAVRYNGITYVYGKSIDFSAYVGIENQTEQRGATLLTLAQDGKKYDITPILAQELEIEWENGVSLTEQGEWDYLVNGRIDKNFTGLASNEYGWWYIKDGAVDFDYTGIVNNEAGWWKVTNGAVDFAYKGLAQNDYGWWKITDGAVDFGYTGLASNEYGWWYIKDGGVDFLHNGVEANEAGWWKITNGAVDFAYTGLAQNDYGWWKITDGAVDFTYTGKATNEFGTWKVVNGQVIF